MKIFFFLTFCLVLGGCLAEQGGMEQESLIINFRIAAFSKLPTEVVDLDTLGIRSAVKMVHKGEVCVLLTPKANYCFAVYNSRTGKVIRLVPIGRNPGEGLHFLGLTLNGDVVSAFDFAMKRLVEIDLRRYAEVGYQPVFTSLGDKNSLGALRVGEHLVSTGIYDQGRYCFTNQNSGAERFSVTYPEYRDKTLNDRLKSILYASNHLAVNPSQTRLACANIQNGCLDICEINEDELSRINEVHLNHPSVFFDHRKPKGRGIRRPVAYSYDNIFGFCDLTISADYIFALYSGRTVRTHGVNVDKGNTVLVFDWNGKHIRTYQLRQSCSSISYDPDKNALFALIKKQNKLKIIELSL